ncbi:MAG: MYXO-CTERM sorting domain-containing protein, partial [Myxococcaceae bacterium]
GTQFEASVASDGTGFFAVWHDYRGTYSHVYGARVSAAGAVLDPSGVLLSGSAGATDYQTDPAIASDGTNYFVVWDDSRSSSIRGTRVTTGGAVLDAASVPVASPPTSLDVLSEPRISFDGANHVVAWENERFNSSYQSLSHTLYALRVSPAAAVLDSRMTVATHPTEDLFATMASDGAGGTLIGYVYPNTSSGYPIDRVRARIFSATPPAGSCTTSAQCASGFCVDGVCCNVACGGGSTDCMACSVAAGAAVDGTCGPVPAGRGCSDGNACTTVDACSAGVCVGSSPVQCAAIDACHVIGACSTATGVCSTPAAPNGTLCPGGACTAGLCVQTPDAGVDAGQPDAGRPDGGSDAGVPDAGRPDGGFDAGAPDAGKPDGGFDAGAPDAGKPDGGFDAGAPDAGLDAGGSSDAGLPDGGGTPPIILPAVDGGVPPGCGCAAGGSSGAGWLMLVALAALVSRGRRARGTAAAGICGRDPRR